MRLEDRHASECDFRNEKPLDHIVEIYDLVVRVTFIRLVDTTFDCADDELRNLAVIRRRRFKGLASAVPNTLTSVTATSYAANWNIAAAN